MLCKWGHLKVCFIHFIWVRLTYTHLVHTHTHISHIPNTPYKQCNTRSSPYRWQCRSYLNRYLETAWWVVCSVCKLKSWSVLEQMEVKRWGVYSWMCWIASVPLRERRLRRKICGEINGCYWEAFNRHPDSIIHVFLPLSIYRGTPLIDNLVSCPLILKDVRLCNKVKSRMFHFFILNVKTSLGMCVNLQFCL